MADSHERFSFLNRMIEKLEQGSEWIHRWVTVLKPCRFPLLTVFAGAAVLLFVPQGTDLLRGLAERVAGTARDSYLRGFFIVSSLFWIVSAWYWSRVMLVLKFPGVPGNEPEFHNFRTKAPRYIGFAAAISVAASLLKASFGYDSPHDRTRQLLLWYALAAFAGAFIFLAVVTKRRDWMASVHDRLQSLQAFPPPFLSPFLGLFNVTPSEKVKYGVHTIRDLPTGMKVAAGATFFAETALFLMFWQFPQQTAPVIGAAAIMFFAMGGWIAAGSLIDISGLLFRIPVITPLLALAVVFSAWNDNHAVRTLLDRPEPLDKRMEVTEALQQWHKRCLLRASSTETCPLFIVAAEGGGIRAAFWTASVLSEIADNNPCFADHVFALSGVSGGSLGSAVFAAQLADANTDSEGFHCDGNGSTIPGTTKIKPVVQKVLGEDFLSPVLGTMLYPDFVQRIIPFPVHSFDRARALEEAWERAWKKHAYNARFSERFDNLWRDANRAWVPALLLNSTWVETGKRLIVSNLKLTADDFSDAEDINAFYTAESLPLSAAVHLSARFTYVSPAGSLKKDGTTYGHAVDGGYFENSGETAVEEILLAIDALKNDDRTWKRVRPVVIHISNEPVEHDQKDVLLSAAVTDTAAKPKARFNEALSPVWTFLNTRNARGVFARETVRWQIGEDEFLHFGLCKERMAIPLGWVLSEEVQAQMENQLSSNFCKAFHNKDKLQIIKNILTKQGKQKGRKTGERHELLSDELIQKNRITPASLAEKDIQ